MKILLFCCAYGRADITRIYAMGVRRLQESFNIDPFTVVSTPEDFDLCKKLDLHPFMAPNKPLGNKHNLGMAEALRKPWNRLVISGSDDLYSSEGIELLLNADRNHVGFRKMYAVNTACDQALYFEYEKNTRIIGAGRLLTREAVESSFTRCIFTPRFSDGKRVAGTDHTFSLAASTHLERRGFGRKRATVTGLWDPSLERNLDNSSDINLSLCGFPPYCVENDKTHIIDLKNEFVQINHYSALMIQESHLQKETKEWKWFLGKEEREAIRQLQYKIDTLAT